MSKALEWARKRGLNCEQDIMAETLRQLCRITILLHICAGCLATLTVIRIIGC